MKKEIIISKNDSGQRVDKFFQKAFPTLPKSLVYKLIRKKDIKVNKKKCDGATYLEEGDIITIFINDVLLSKNQSNLKNKNFSFLKAQSELNIIYEDSNLILIFKPVGLTVHCDDNHTEDTLINRVKHYLYKKGDYNPDNEQSFSPALCNRLDRNTSGIVIAAKNAFALREINRLIRENKIQKNYLCITIALPPKKSDIIHAYHKKSDKDNKVIISDYKADEFHEIITGYKILAQNADKLALVKISLITGRTHQIRAHMAYIKAPLLGDNKYGNYKINQKYHCKSQQLCAYEIQFKTGDDSVLSYLNQRCFYSDVPNFVSKYFPDLKLNQK